MVSQAPPFDESRPRSQQASPVAAPLISEPAQADAAWFTTVLRANGMIGPEAVVTAVRARRIGTGLVGQNIQFRLRYRGHTQDAPASLVGKFPSPEEQSRATAKALRTYEREVGFYSELAARVGSRIPRCFLADIDVASDRFVLLLEDLSPATQGDQIAGCSIQQAVLAMDELAGLHAPTWDDASLADIDWLSRAGDPATQEMTRTLYESCWPGFASLYAERLGPAAVDLGEALGRSLATWQSYWQPPNCLTHGDYRLDNMLFGTDAGGYPLATVDWQTVGQGPPVLDAAYFIGNGPPVESRRAHEMELLRQYHRALQVRGVTDYPWTRLREDYRWATFSGVLMSVIASQLVARDERATEMFAVMAERHLAHAVDQRAGELLV